jgi:hypothetical protein
MPTDVSLVAGASSLTAGARKALIAALAAEEDRLLEEGNAAGVDRALAALDYATALLDRIMGPADDARTAGRVERVRRHELDELRASITAAAPRWAVIRHEHEELARQAVAGRRMRGVAVPAWRPPRARRLYSASTADSS